MVKSSLRGDIMKKLVILLLFGSFLFAKVDYSQMSNEELIALIGYVSMQNQEDFLKELEKRKRNFSEEELEKYQEEHEKYKEEQEKKDDNTTS